MNHNLPLILSGLKAAYPGIRVVGMNYYDPFLASWLTGSAGQTLAQQSATQADGFNALLAGIYTAAGFPTADVATAFQNDDFSLTGTYNSQTLPQNVANICNWTHMCEAADIHANNAGHATIAQAFETLLDTPAPPDAPISVVATARNASASVRWSVPATNSSTITGYVVTPYLGSVAQATQTFATATTTELVTGLVNAKSYSFRVAARNAVGTGARSGPSATITIGAPGPPTGAVAFSESTSTSVGTLGVRYAAGANNGATVTKYTATCTSGNGGATRAGVHAFATAGTITIGGVTTARSYTCRVTATNSRGTSVPSVASTSVIVGAPAAPPRPTVVRVAPGRLTVSFLPPANNGAAITSYAATCSSTNGGVSRAQIAGAVPFTVTALTPAKTYTCVARATNSRGASPASAPSAPVGARRRLAAGTAQPQEPNRRNPTAREGDAFGAYFSAKLCSWLITARRSPRPWTVTRRSPTSAASTARRSGIPASTPERCSRPSRSGSARASRSQPGSSGGRSPSTTRSSSTSRDDRIVLRAENRSSARSTRSRSRTRDHGATVVAYDARLEPKGSARLADPLLAIAFRRIGDRAAAGLAPAPARGVGVTTGHARVRAGLRSTTRSSSRSSAASAASDSRHARALFDWDADARCRPDRAGSRSSPARPAGSGSRPRIALARAAPTSASSAATRQRTDAARGRRSTPRPTRSVEPSSPTSPSSTRSEPPRTAFVASVPRLDVLIHNAGALVHELRRTADGLELTAQVHVVAPFLLTTLLLPRLQATAATPASSRSRRAGCTRSVSIVDALDAPAVHRSTACAPMPTPSGPRSCSTSAGRASPAGRGIVVPRDAPRLGRHAGRAASRCPRFRARDGARSCASAEQGADTMAWLAGAPEALESNGAFWLDRRRRVHDPAALDAHARRRRRRAAGTGASIARDRASTATAWRRR